jgi:hypothetical protein
MNFSGFLNASIAFSYKAAASSPNPNYEAAIIKFLLKSFKKKN